MKSPRPAIANTLSCPHEPGSGAGGIITVSFFKPSARSSAINVFGDTPSFSDARVLLHLHSRKVLSRRTRSTCPTARQAIVAPASGLGVGRVCSGALQAWARGMMRWRYFSRICPSVAGHHAINKMFLQGAQTPSQPAGDQHWVVVHAIGNGELLVIYSHSKTFAAMRIFGQGGECC